MRNNPSKVKKMLKDNVSMNRFGTTNEISNLVTFLSSEMASFITGSIYVVDGGQTRS
jgi:NAD(P)-dependent dehydrogenase (short-subunit alcohol dehydrogenase family)